MKQITIDDLIPLLKKGWVAMDKDGYGIEIDNHTLSANTFVNNKLSAKGVK